MQVRLQDLITQLITTTLHLISDNHTASLTAINLVITIDKKKTLHFSPAGDREAKLHASMHILG